MRSADCTDQSYSATFRKITECAPYNYQRQVADLLFEGRNVVLRAPTGAGKTWAVLTPFFCDQWVARPHRLIYALPLRTLANGIYAEARRAAAKFGKPLEAEIHNRRETISPFVTLQTGEQPDDPFFDRGRIIVTTYDQVLSGILCSPYGLSERLHNVNAAAIAGALVVFDEFHLMPASRAFLTGVAALRLFSGLCQSVWMTATATAPLEQLLVSTLEAVSVPKDEDEQRAMHASLPSVISVHRSLTLEARPLTADSILRLHKRRSIVIVNTVGRAQTLFADLRAQLNDTNVELILLHSRFFKNDRSRLEARLTQLFGNGAPGSAILVATQVIEAGVDISCEHLHTELCPMNSLAQRAGRCARFADETGLVHVYPLPDEPRSWLPYGSLEAPDPTLKATGQLLAGLGESEVNPALIARWVQCVHADDDAKATRQGYRPRLKELTGCISRNTIQREPAGVAHLIRGENSESIRVLIAAENARPESPGKLESIALLRWSLASYVNGGAEIGWYWSAEQQEPWQPLKHRANLGATYVVCLRPEFAGYDADVGLRLGQAGLSSPVRIEPPRPGYPALREELWSNHAQMVAAEAEARFSERDLHNGLLARGYRNRYRLEASQLSLVLRTCGLLHDLGKLQSQWQQWAIKFQSKNCDYIVPGPLAHTDFDYDSREDRERGRTLGVSRPPHTAASAFYSFAFLPKILADLLKELRPYVASACAAAIISHHGAFIPRQNGIGLGLLSLIDSCYDEVSKVCGHTPDAALRDELAKCTDKRGFMTQSLKLTTALENLERWWPLVAYLMRTLRLADQRATSEWSCRE